MILGDISFSVDSQGIYFAYTFGKFFFDAFKPKTASAIL